ncbi:MAG: lysoplasmalogenase family protein, partial [Owenweeksia sp.]
GIILGLNFIVASLFGLSKNKALLVVPLGVLLFMTSDLVLAFQKFSLALPDKYLQMGIMVLYGVAQYLIVTGVLRYLLPETSDQSSQG